MQANFSSGVGGLSNLEIWSLIESCLLMEFSEEITPSRTRLDSFEIISNFLLHGVGLLNLFSYFLGLYGKGLLNRPIYYFSDSFYAGALSGAPPKKLAQSCKLVCCTRLQSSQTAMPWFWLLAAITDLQSRQYYTEAVEWRP